MKQTKSGAESHRRKSHEAESQGRAPCKKKRNFARGMLVAFILHVFCLFLTLSMSLFILPLITTNETSKQPQPSNN